MNRKLLVAGVALAAGVAFVTFLLISSGYLMDRQFAPPADRTDPLLLVVPDNQDAINRQFEEIRQDNPELAATFAVLYASRFDPRLLNSIPGLDFGPDDIPCVIAPWACPVFELEPQLVALMEAMERDRNWCRTDSRELVPCQIVWLITQEQKCLDAKQRYLDAEAVLNQTNPPPTLEEKLNAIIQQGEAASDLLENDCAAIGITV